MRLLTYREGLEGDARIGVLLGDDVLDLTAASALLGSPAPPTDMSALLRTGRTGLDRVAGIVERCAADRRALRPLQEVDLLAPVPAPSKVVCVGLNHRGLADRVRFEAGEGAPVFLKAPSSVTGAADGIRLPPLGMGDVLLEVELGVVIGATGRGVDRSKAFDLIAGYTVLLDLTAQSMMERDAYRFTPPGADGPSGVKHIVLFRAKDFDTFTPLGPVLLTRDELEDDATASLPIRARINGETAVDGNTRDLLVGIPDLIEYMSSVTTLVPGDVIATGHPGSARPEPLTLAPGDRVEASIGPIGTLDIRVAPERQ